MCAPFSEVVANAKASWKIDKTMKSNNKPDIISTRGYRDLLMCFA